MVDLRSGTMRLYVFALLLFLLVLGVFESVEGRRTRFKPKPKEKKTEKSVEEITPAKDININQIGGKWYLLTVASRCQHLLEKGFKVESTIINLTPPVSPRSPLKVSTFTKLNYQCWEIKQNYETTNSTGRFLLKGNMPVMNVEILIIDTDYSSYAILLYKRMKKITMKLYGRSTQVPEAIQDKYEELARKHNLGLDLNFQFPDYGFCESADKEHTLVMT
ncbi:complement component C8 gamma chain [Astyanax mexicanus]|uniref:Complement component C8 gamma chain n=2 Tax=Astyanax mexicanus TaxID=7994 RepID=A0A8B9R6M8_ASTMX|nr:complement component C8 gamma chain [Astyanax mexicanus]KAG9283266.1 complement component C8 gamma chain [Astyanax mexicanus]